MKSFRITKIIYAKDIQDALKKEDKAELVDIELTDEVDEPEKVIVGFGK